RHAIPSAHHPAAKVHGGGKQRAVRAPLLHPRPPPPVPAHAPPPRRARSPSPAPSAQEEAPTLPPAEANAPVIPPHTPARLRLSLGKGPPISVYSERGPLRSRIPRAQPPRRGPRPWHSSRALRKGARPVTSPSSNRRRSS